MSKVSRLQVKGLAAVQHKLEKLRGIAIPAVEKAVIEGNNLMLNEAKATSMFADKTGILRASIAPVVEHKADMVEATVVAKAPHAHLVELGHAIVKGKRGKTQTTHGSVPGRPFMRTAFNAHSSKAKAMIRKAVAESVKKLAGGSTGEGE